MTNIRRSVGKRLHSLAGWISPPDSKAPIEPHAAPPPDKVAVETTPTPIERFLHAPPQNIEVVTNPDALQRLVDLTGATWTQLGKQSAHWSVLTWPEFLEAEIDESRFFRTGEHDFIVLSRFFERSSLTMPFNDSVLELGCGVGRVTKQLATHFRAVTAVDISEPHLSLATKYMEASGLENVRFVQLKRPADIDEISQVGLFYSIIVLQHNPPPVAFDLLRRCLLRVRPGGFSFFQIPTFSKDYCFNVENYIPDEQGRMEMHATPQTKVLSLLQQSGFDILEVLEDGAAGSPNIVSHTFFARRRV